MTDNEIIKALENEIRSAEYVDSYYCNGVDLTLIKSTVDLINRQQAEIERLKECPKCIYEYDGNTTEYCIQGPCSNFKTAEQVMTEAYKENKKLKAEIERLQSMNRAKLDTIHDLQAEIERLKINEKTT